MPRLELLRHAMTQGNLEGRWTGTTDQGLCPEGTALARRNARPSGAIPRRVWVSPLRRCRETAALLYPGAEQTPVPGLRETDFGPFENKNHRELAGNPLYEAWVKSVGTAPVPGLESRAQVLARAQAAFRPIARELSLSGTDGAIVTHGGVLMALCAAFVKPERDYAQWWVPCCGGWLLDLGDWEQTERLSVIREILPEKEKDR